MLEEEQRATLGMWVFLATEVMLFGGAFMAFAVLRYLHTATFTAGSHHLNLVLGTANTAVLLTSSLFVARAAQSEKPRWWLLSAVGLGLVFLALKLLEWREHLAHHLAPLPDFAWSGADPGAAKLFFWLYFFMTGLHAVHVTIGLGVLAWAAFAATKRIQLEVCGLYWHLVDVVWIFLFPLFYLIGHRA